MYRYTDNMNVYPDYQTNHKLLNLANTSQDSYIARNVYLILIKVRVITFWNTKNRNSNGTMVK